MGRMAALILLSIMLFLSACSSSESTTSKQTGGSAPKDIVVAVGSEPPMLDPQNGIDTSGASILGLVYDKLVTFDKDMKLVPELAKEWKFSSDGKNLTFILREGVKFQDGTPFNADAVKTNFDRVLNKDNKLSNYNTFNEFVDHITVDSENQVIFHMKFPFGAAVTTFAHQSGMIISPKAIKEAGKEVAKKPVGTGPYKFKSWTPGDKMVFEANPDYWGKKPAVSSFTFKTVPENSARSLMLENGEADIIFPVPPTDIERLKGNAKLQINAYPTNMILYLGMNEEKAPFNNVKVRQALNYAVDKETIIKKIMLGNGKVAQSLMGDQAWGFTNVGSYPYDPEKAKQLLAEAGVQPGTTIKLWTPDGRYFMDRQIAEFVQGNLKDVGLNVQFQKWEWAAYQEALRSKKEPNDLYLVAWVATTNDADWSLRPVLKTGSSQNYGGFTNPQIDALLDKGMKTVKEDERKDYYKQAQELIKEQAPWVNLVQLTSPIGTQKNVEGVYAQSTTIINYRDVVKK